MCGCTKAKVPPKETMGMLFRATRDGFAAMIEMKEAEGFKPEDSYQEGSGKRVQAILGAFERAYKDVDLGGRHHSLMLTAGAIINLKDIIDSLEAAVNMTEEDSHRIDTALAVVSTTEL